MPQDPLPRYHYHHSPSRYKAKTLLELLKPFREFVCNFQWIHIGIEISGNSSFFIGSIFFLWESLKMAGVWLFILGSFGILLSSIGSAIVKLEQAPSD